MIPQNVYFKDMTDDTMLSGRMLLGADWKRNEDEKKICRALEQVAKEVGAKHITAGKIVATYCQAHITDTIFPFSVAIAYVMQKAPYVFPLVGGRKVEHLMSNIEALDISLSEEHIAFLESILPFERGRFYTYFVSSQCLSVHTLSLIVSAVDLRRELLTATTTLCTRQPAISISGHSSRLCVRRVLGTMTRNSNPQ